MIETSSTFRLVGKLLRAAFVAACAIAYLAGGQAGAHEVMGQHDHDGPGTPSYLLGHRIGSKRTELVNCCKHRGPDGREEGDCHMISPERVLEATKDGVDGFYLFPISGDRAPDFVPASEVTVSPDEHFYACQHGPVAESGPLEYPGPHCLFIPKSFS
jgi:hypothetical protein